MYVELELVRLVIYKIIVNLAHRTENTVTQSTMSDTGIVTALCGLGESSGAGGTTHKKMLLSHFLKVINLTLINLTPALDGYLDTHRYLLLRQ